MDGRLEISGRPYSKITCGANDTIPDVGVAPRHLLRLDSRKRFERTEENVKGGLSGYAVQRCEGVNIFSAKVNSLLTLTF